MVSRNKFFVELLEDYQLQLQYKEIYTIDNSGLVHSKYYIVWH